MSVSVRCPGCEISSSVPPELLGRTGRCNQCGRRLRLATPTAELLDTEVEPAARTAAGVPASHGDLPLIEGLGELDPLGDLSELEPAPDARRRPISTPTPKPTAIRPTPETDPVPEKPAPRPNRGRVAPPRGPSKVLLAVLALVGLFGGGAFGVVLVKYLVPPEQQAGPRAAVDPPAPAPVPAPAPQPPGPTPPEPKPEPKPQPSEPKPPALAGPKNAVKLPGAAVTVTAGGGGRFIVFQTTGEVVVYDNQIGRTSWTLNGVRPEDLIACSRTKLFLGRVKDAQISRFDLATGTDEGQTPKGVPASLRHLAIGSASDGPLLVVTHVGAAAYRFRVVDPNTFVDLAYPIDDPTEPALRGFPLTVAPLPRWVAAGADGRALMLGNRYLVRSEDRYVGGLLPNTGSAQHLPTPDGQAFVGTRLYAADATPLPAAELPPGTTRRYIPAATGSFVVSAEYKVTDPSTVKLFLHLGTDPKPLGPLPGGDEVAAWAKGEPGWVGKLHHRLIFVPDPGALIFCPPDAAAAHFYPINMAGMLAAGGRDVAFTSTPAAEFQPGRAYTYRATAVAVRGPITFALQAGPPGATVTRDGVLTWPQPSDRASHEVTITASDARGGRTIQTFRLLPPRNGATAPPPK